uniref:Uncharacterized protein n=1 Tax=uncultured marine virus TaxID=186617 RepID=A0A0F7L885_9VIRU|nr:hypothetical protein [uncultured marine virus]
MLIILASSYLSFTPLPVVFTLNVTGWSIALFTEYVADQLFVGLYVVTVVPLQVKTIVTNWDV